MSFRLIKAGNTFQSPVDEQAGICRDVCFSSSFPLWHGNLQKHEKNMLRLLCQSWNKSNIQYYSRIIRVLVLLQWPSLWLLLYYASMEVSIEVWANTSFKCLFDCVYLHITLQSQCFDRRKKLSTKSTCCINILWGKDWLWFFLTGRSQVGGLVTKSSLCHSGGDPQFQNKLNPAQSGTGN